MVSARPTGEWFSPGPVRLAVMATLPDDPQDWTDEQWLAWLAEGDAEERARLEAEQDSDHPPLPSWRKAPIAAQFLAASMLGVAEAIYGPKDEPAIISEAPGEPPGDDGFELHLDPDKPDESVILVRPWLLRAADRPDDAEQ